MAASDDGEEDLLVETIRREISAAKQRATSDNEDDADGDAHADATFRINPEVLRGVPPLPNLDDIEVVLIQPAHVWARWSEGLMIHVVGSGIVAVLAFIAGLTFAGATDKAEGAVKQPPSCITNPVSAPAEKAE